MVGNDPVNRFDLLGFLQLTERCEVVLFVGHNGDVTQDLARWNELYRFAKKSSPNDSSVASALSCAYPAGDNGADGIPGFIDSGNGLIGWNEAGHASNGGMTPNDDPKNAFDNDKESREAFGFLKLILTNYHAGLQAADNIVDKMKSASGKDSCCSVGTFKVVFSSDWRSTDANDSQKTFGGVNIRGAIDQFQRHFLASPNLQNLTGVPNIFIGTTQPCLACRLSHWRSNSALASHLS